MMDLKAPFLDIGGSFLVDNDTFKRKIMGVRAFIFDWDGVFNDGFKSDDQGSPFSEASSMGINMLRFSYYLREGVLPWIGILSGENNLRASFFAKREHLNAVLLRSQNKAKAIAEICTSLRIEPGQVGFIFDDILDLKAAEYVGLRCAVRRRASPLFYEYLNKYGLADYISGCEGQQHAVREICELVISYAGNMEETLKKRMDHGKDYTQYLHKRSQIIPVFSREDVG